VIGIRHDDEGARQIVEGALDVRICEPFSGIIMSSDDYPTGACIFNNYNGRDVHFTCVSHGLLKMSEARFVARYVFKKLGCHRCTAVTRGTNERAIKALVQLGFRYEGTLREHFEDADGAMFGLLRSEQRIVRL
jgi:hypothetical protein